MDDKRAYISGGGSMSFAGVLQVIFIVLKLCHVIDWSWLWVFAPTWISIGLVLIILLMLFIIIMVTR